MRHRKTRKRLLQNKNQTQSYVLQEFQVESPSGLLCRKDKHPKEAAKCESTKEKRMERGLQKTQKQIRSILPKKILRKKRPSIQA